MWEKADTSKPMVSKASSSDSVFADDNSSTSQDEHENEVCIKTQNMG